MRAILAFILMIIVSSCAVTGVERYYTSPKTSEKILLNARVNGSTLNSYVIVDGQELIKHSFPPFVNSTSTQEINYKGHKIRAVFKMIKSIGTSTVVIVVFIDDEMASEFVF